MQFLEQAQNVRAKYASAYTAFMAGQLAWEEFEPIKKEWGKISATLGKMRAQNSRQIEKDLRSKYGDQKYAQHTG